MDIKYFRDKLLELQVPNLQTLQAPSLQTSRTFTLKILEGDPELAAKIIQGLGYQAEYRYIRDDESIDYDEHVVIVSGNGVGTDLFEVILQTYGHITFASDMDLGTQHI